MLRRILVGLDGSPYAHSAMEAACMVAQSTGATVVGIAVVDMPGIDKSEIGATPGALHYAEKVREHKIREAEERTKKSLEQFSSFCKTQNVSCELAFSVGVPFKEIIEEARTSDLVFVGIKTFFHYETQTKSGDTLKKLLDVTVSPVIAVPKEFQKPKNILFAYDGGPQAAKALRMFLQLGLFTDAKATVLNVTEDIEEGRNMVNQAAKYLAAHEFETETLCMPGEPKEVIYEIAKKLMPSMVVIGAYSHSSLREFLFGTAASYLVEDGSVPLFVYH